MFVYFLVCDPTAPPPGLSIPPQMLRDSGLMEERDHDTYVSLFNNMSNFMKKPNIIVHLDVTPEESLARIHERCGGDVVRCDVM